MDDLNGLIWGGTGQQPKRDQGPQSLSGMATQHRGQPTNQPMRPPMGSGYNPYGHYHSSPSPVPSPSPASASSSNSSVLWGGGAQQPASVNSTPKPASSGSDPFGSIASFNTKQEPKTLAEKQQAQQQQAHKPMQGFSNPSPRPAQVSQPTPPPSTQTPAGWDAGFFETLGSKPQPAATTPAATSQSSLDDPFGDFFGTPAPKAKAPSPAPVQASENDWGLDAFEKPPQQSAPVQRQPAPSADEVDFSIFDAPKSKPQSPAPVPVVVVEEPKATPPPQNPQQGKRQVEVEDEEEEDAEQARDAEEYYEPIDPPAQPRHQTSRTPEEPPSRSAQRRQHEERDMHVTQKVGADEDGYGHAYGEPSGSSSGSGSGGGFGFGFGSGNALLGKVMGGVSKVSEKATKLTTAAVKVAAEKSSQVKNYVNQTLEEGLGGTTPRVRKDAVKELVEMGFSESDSAAALYVSNNDVFDALDVMKSTEKLNAAHTAYKASLANDARRSTPPVRAQSTDGQPRSRPPATSSPNSIPNQRLAAQKFDEMADQMTAMGYSLNDIYDSLAVTNDVDKAIEILTKKGIRPEKKAQGQHSQHQQQQPPQQSRPQQQQPVRPQPTQPQPQYKPQQPSPAPAGHAQRGPSAASSRSSTPSAKEAAAKFDEMVEGLMAMGFSMGDAYDALAHTNDFDKAVELLQKKNQPQPQKAAQPVSHHHQPQQQQQQQQQQLRPQQGQPQGQPRPQQPGQPRPQQQQQQPGQGQGQPRPQQPRPQQPGQPRPQQNGQVPSASSSPAPKSATPKVATPKPEVPPLNPQLEQQVNAIKEKGNALFKAGDFAAAKDVYNEALKLIPEGHPASIPLLNNRGASYLKMDSFKNAIEDCTKVLLLTDNSDTKALLRRAQAYEALEQLQQSFADYKAILSIDPSLMAASQGSMRVSKAMRTLEKSKQEESNPKPPKPAADLISNEAPMSKPASKAPSPTPPGSSNPNDFSMFENLDSKPAEPKPFVTQGMNARAAEDHRKQYEEAEREMVQGDVNAKLMGWKQRKEDNIRALLSTMNLVLWEGIEWKNVSLADLVTPQQVKVAYMKAVNKVHPDKVYNATMEQKLLAEGAFDALNKAYDLFRAQNGL